MIHIRTDNLRRRELKKSNINPEIISHVTEIRDFSLSTGIDIMEIIMEKVSEAFNISSVDITSRTRKAEIIKARHLFCWVAKYMTLHTTENIGQVIKRDHATVLYSTRKTMDYLSEEVYGDKKIKEKLREIVNKVKKEINFKSFIQEDISEELYKKALSIVNRYLAQKQSVLYGRNV